MSCINVPCIGRVGDRESEAKISSSFMSCQCGGNDVKKDTQTHGGLAKGIPRNRLATPSKVPRKVASSKRAVGVLTGGEREVQVATK